MAAAFDAETQHAAAHAVAVLLQGDCVLGVGGEAGVVDGDDVRGGIEGGGDGGGVVGGFAGAEVEGFEAAVSEPAVECRGHGADCVLQEGQTFVEGLGVEGGDAHEDVGVAVDILGDGVDDDVGAVVERVLHVGAQEGVIDHDHDAVLMGDGGDFADVDEGQGRVAGAFDPDEFRFVRPDQVFYVDFDRWGECDLHAVRGGDLGEVTMRTTVNV